MFFHIKIFYKRSFLKKKGSACFCSSTFIIHWQISRLAFKPQKFFLGPKSTYAKDYDTFVRTLTENKIITKMPLTLAPLFKSNKDVPMKELDYWNSLRTLFGTQSCLLKFEKDKRRRNRDYTYLIHWGRWIDELLSSKLGSNKPL